MILDPRTCNWYIISKPFIERAGRGYLLLWYCPWSNAVGCRLFYLWLVKP